MADLHLGAKNLKLPLEKQKILLQEHLNSLEKVFNQKCDIVIICGDVFHSKIVSQKIINIFFKQVEQFAKPVLYVYGNHDEKINFVNKPKNFYILNEQSNVFRTENVDFWCLSKDYQNFDNSKKNVLLLHGSISNKMDHDYLDLSNIMSKNFDYVALGHEHSFWQEKKNKTILAYSGALFANGFDECGEKGFILLDCNSFNPVFQPLKQRNFKIINLSVSDISNFGGLEEKFKEMVSSEKQNIIRVIFTGYFQENQEFDFNKLKFDYNGFYIEFVDKTKIQIDIDKYKNEPLSFKAEFIKLVESSNLSEEDKNKVLKIGIEGLQGDDLSI